MLSAVVISQENHPGTGFFKLARRLKFRVNDDDTFWQQELQRVVTYWTRH